VTTGVDALGPAPSANQMDADHADGPGVRGAKEPLLTVKDLRVSFGGLVAVAGATFCVKPGTITGLIGPNGAGKSTAVNAIAGQVPGASGSVTFDGHGLLGRKPHQIALLGIRRSFQVANLFDGMTVIENLLLGARPWDGESVRSCFVGRRKWRQRESELAQKALSIMEHFGVQALVDELAGNLSGGQKRILELMRILMSEPKMMLLDEPMAGINPMVVQTISKHLRRLREEGSTMLMIEHDLSLIEELCDSVIVMANGSVIAEGTLEELRQNETVVNAYLAG
jgi:ABC-type branched-subunit amino acid transport system ATPase component